MFDVERILAIPDQSIDYLQMGISGGERAALAARGFVRKDGTKAKDYMIRTIQKAEKNKAKAEKAIIKGDKKFSWDENIPWGENRKALKNHLEKLGVSTGDEGVAPDSYWKDRVKRLERAAELTKKDPKSITQAEFDEMIDTLPAKHPIATEMRDWQRDTLKDSARVKALKSKYGENARLTEIYKNEVYSKAQNTPITPDRTTTKSNRGLEVTYNKKGDLSSAATAAKAKKAISGQAKGGKVVKGVKPSDRGVTKDITPYEAAKKLGIKGVRPNSKTDAIQKKIEQHFAGENAAKLLKSGKTSGLPQYKNVSETAAKSFAGMVYGNKFIIDDRNWTFDGRGQGSIVNDLVSGGLLESGNDKYVHKLTQVGKELAKEVFINSKNGRIKEQAKTAFKQPSPVAKKLGTPPKKKPIF